jgi:hypothetical protein
MTNILPHRAFQPPWLFQYTDEQWLRIRNALVRAGLETRAKETSQTLPSELWPILRTHLIRLGLEPNDRDQTVTVTSETGSVVRDKLNDLATEHLKYMKARGEIIQTPRDTRVKTFERTIVQIRKARRALQNPLVELFVYRTVADEKRYTSLIEALSEAEERCTRACNDPGPIVRPQKDEDFVEGVISVYLELGGRAGNDSGPGVEFIRAVTEPFIGAKSPLLTGPALRARLRRIAALLE